jgi:hypothetical protein
MKRLMNLWLMAALMCGLAASVASLGLAALAAGIVLFSKRRQSR